MADKIEIRLFEGFAIYLNDEQILKNLSNTRKTKLFVAYLLVNRDRAVTHRELFELLWSGEDYANPGTALRTLLYRFRAMLEKEGALMLANAVVSKRGTYQWNTNLQVSIDVVDFEGLAATGFNSTVSAGHRKECLKQAIGLYTGSLLPDFETEPWMIAKASYYRDLYIDVVESYIQLLKSDKNYIEIVKVAEHAISLVGACEVLELEAAIGRMQIVGTSEKGAESLERYYDQVKKFSEQLHEQTDRIQNDLEDDTIEQNAFVCDYRTFKEIYRLQRRTLARTKSTMFLALVDVRAGFEEGAADLVKYERVMADTITCLSRGLRCGDAICRKDDTQIAILFPSESYSDAMGVLERLKISCKERVGEDVVIVYRVRPLKNAKD